MISGIYKRVVLKWLPCEWDKYEGVVYGEKIIYSESNGFWK